MKRTVFIGTYTGGESKGIYALRFDDETEALDDFRLAAETPSPSFLALHPNKKFLYAVNETRDYEGTTSGSITAFEITDVRGGVLEKLNTKSAHGGSPCHLAVTPEGISVITANYHGGTVGVIEIKPDGSLGKTLNAIKHEGSSVNKARQEAPHPHAVNVDPNGRFVFVADLGTDTIEKYRLRESGQLTPLNEPTRVAAGSGPRHFAFHPSGRF
ncbi:MAG: lactonase family protein, partial [Akkermansiaceae bacterium]|nr:lactonase family protein [Akkermansiaceae bacterium]